MFKGLKPDFDNKLKFIPVIQILLVANLLLNLNFARDFFILISI